MYWCFVVCCTLRSMRRKDALPALKACFSLSLVAWLLFLSNSVHWALFCWCAAFGSSSTSHNPWNTIYPFNSLILILLPKYFTFLSLHLMRLHFNKKTDDRDDSDDYFGKGSLLKLLLQFCNLQLTLTTDCWAWLRN